MWSMIFKYPWDFKKGVKKIKEKNKKINMSLWRS
ncbi:MAG: hypothetical protein CM1200mP5_2320 [Candidatus Pelagibacterales bacterium]|nr:MAG: hypothetical protein CM1200mP5_2320 [Pelagibacterales bacterium]